MIVAPGLSEGEEEVSQILGGKTVERFKGEEEDFVIWITEMVLTTARKPSEEKPTVSIYTKRCSSNVLGFHSFVLSWLDFCNTFYSGVLQASVYGFQAYANQVT